MTAEVKDIRLIVEIKNKEPLELIELTKSLVSLGNQFNNYASQYGDSKENKEAKLFVKEIKTGSVILDLVEYATVGSIPFVENMNTILGFTNYIKSTVDYFLKKEGTKPELSESDYKDFSSILNPIAKDNSSQINFSSKIDGNVYLTVNIDSNKANALQNLFRNEINDGKKPELQGDIHNKVLFYWHQAKNDLSSDAGNKGIIESISSNALRVIFDNEEIKGKMLKGETNPFNHAFVVDVKVDTIKGKPSLYKIVSVHEVIDKEE